MQMVLFVYYLPSDTRDEVDLGETFAKFCESLVSKPVNVSSSFF